MSTENHPEVMTKLAHELGLSSALAFHDIYSLTDPDLIALVPRPAHALLFTFPDTDTSIPHRAHQKATDAVYEGSGPDEPVLWYPQYVRNACGLMGLLHCTVNDPAAGFIEKASALDQFRQATISLKPKDRGEFIHDSEVLEKAHAAASQAGDTVAPELGGDPGHAFIAYVKGKDGHLYELDGGRGGPVDLGVLQEEEDVLSKNALDLGPLQYVKREGSGGGTVAFSCTVLAPSFV